MEITIQPVDKIVHAICNMPWRCPVHDAGAECDCNGAQGVCPIKDALVLANKAKGGAL